MADDRMKNDDLQRNMGARGEGDQDFGQQSPGRNPAKVASRVASTGGQGGQQRERQGMNDDDGRRR
jgi:hypothetical protein